MKLIEKTQSLLKQKKYFKIFLFSTITYIIVSLILIKFFYINFYVFLSRGIFSYLEFTLMLITAILFGVNMMFVSFTFSQVKNYAKQKRIGIFSAFVGLLVAGCPACSLALISLSLPYIGALITLPVFPLHGLEIQLTGILLMSISLFFVSKDLSC